MLTVGQQITLDVSGRTARVERLIGEGGQGTVYEASIEGEPSNLALKWYFPHTGTSGQRSSIEGLIRRGSPSQRFLWPTELVELPGEAAFGYLMPLRPEGHETLSSLLKGRIDAHVSVRTTLCRDLARSFLNLHSQGLCYRDISFGNIFLDPVSGLPLICDNDNVAIDDGSPSPVLGTRKFMAPEIVRGEAQPSTVTDLWSLAVLLFYILVVGHPLLGRRERDYPCWDEQAELAMFGHDPVFLFDPDSDVNRPDPLHDRGVFINWQKLPLYIRELFTRAFTDGIADPLAGRVAESVWQRAMARLEDSIVVCQRCGADLFYDPDDAELACWSCRAPTPRPMRLLFPDGRWVAVSDRTRIWDHHVARLPNYEFQQPVAEVTEHPGRQGVWGLRNVSDQPWHAKPPEGNVVEVEPHRTFALIPGSVFRFGETRAELEA